MTSGGLWAVRATAALRRDDDLGGDRRPHADQDGGPTTLADPLRAVRAVLVRARRLLEHGDRGAAQAEAVDD